MQRATMAKVSKSITLPIPHAERLEQEDNQSATIEEALEEFWDDW